MLEIKIRIESIRKQIQIKRYTNNASFVLKWLPNKDTINIYTTTLVTYIKNYNAFYWSKYGQKNDFPVSKNDTHKNF